MPPPVGNEDGVPCQSNAIVKDILINVDTLTFIRQIDCISPVPVTIDIQGSESKGGEGDRQQCRT
jgi:hypothetical protein